MTRTVEQEKNLASAKSRIEKLQAGTHKIASVGIAFVKHEAMVAGLDLDTNAGWQELGITREEFEGLARQRLIEAAQEQISKLKEGSGNPSVQGVMAIKFAQEAGLDLRTPEAWLTLGVADEEAHRLAAGIAAESPRPA